MTTNATELHRADAQAASTWLWRLTLAGIAVAAVRFYIHYPLHYIVEQTPASYGGYWPHRWWLRLHIAGASIALVTGPFQLWSGLRRRHLTVHRTIGYGYLAGAVLGGIGAFGLALWSAAADHGVSVFVFAMAWWVSLGMAFRAVLARRILEHQDWMVRGYVLTYGFVSIRAVSELPVWSALGAMAEPTQNWLGWVVPVLLADVVMRWRRGRPTRAHGAT